MATVTGRAREVKQPRGGYLNIKSFEETKLNDGIELYEDENIHANLIGMAVDYLTRFLMGTPKEDAFAISMIGAHIAKDSIRAEKLLEQINGSDDNSVICACKLVGYDVCYRAGMRGYKDVGSITPDEHTIFNIRTMVERCLKFWSLYGPIVKDGFTFEGGYTRTVVNGDGDYLTQDTLWDFKVSVKRIKSTHTLQLLMYYIMGCHSVHAEFNNIKKLGIYNPRLNTVYIIKVDSIDKDVIKAVEDDVICYGKPAQQVEEKKTTEEAETKTAEKTDDWLLRDLTARYNVSSAKITADFIGRGLPYHKVGRAYHFEPEKVKQWELETRSIPYGRNDKIDLPAFVEYRESMLKRLENAKQAKNKGAVKEIKHILAEQGIDIPTESFGNFGYILIVVCVVAIIFFMSMIVTLMIIK